MNTLKTVIVALFATLAMNAQNIEGTEVPESFTEGLLKIYPNATDITWERNSDNYKVEFKDGNLDHVVNFNKNGDKVRVESEVVAANLPTVIAQDLKKNYADFMIDSVHSINKNDIITYKIVLQKRDWIEEITLTYSGSGQILNENKY